MTLAARRCVYVLAVSAVVVPLVGCGQDEPAVVPHLRAEASAQAQQALDRLDVTVKVRQQWSDRIARGRVLSSTPPAGAEVQGGVVTLTVSKGEPPGPFGTLGKSSAGPVQVGMTAAEVEEHFGPPDEQQQVNYGAGPAPQTDWRWQQPGGVFVLMFDRRRNPVTVAGYCTTSPKLKAALLDLRVGEVTGSAVVKAATREGEQPTLAYDPRRHGERRNVLLSEREPGTYPGLRFNVDDTGMVAEICGGHLPPAGE